MICNPKHSWACYVRKMCTAICQTDTSPLSSTGGKQCYQASLWWGSAILMSQQTSLSGCVWYIGRDEWAGSCLAGFQSLVTACVKILLCADKNVLAWRDVTISWSTQHRDGKDDAWIKWANCSHLQWSAVLYVENFPLSKCLCCNLDIQTKAAQ